MIRVRAISAFLTILVPLVSQPCHADVIRLRASATIAPDAPVRLSDIAHLEGDDARACALVILVDKAGDRLVSASWFEIDIDDVRIALEAAEKELSRFALGGSTCVVRARESRSRAGTPRALRQQEPERFVPEAPATVRSLIASRIANAHDASVTDVRLGFIDTRDPILDLTPADGRIAITHVSADGKRAVFRVEVINDGSTIAHGAVCADVELKRRVLIARDTVRRGRELTVADFDAKERWIPPTLDAVLDPADAIGRRVARPLAQESIITTSDLEPALLVHRNEQVTIVCLNRSVQVKMPGRAMADGAKGDLIEIQRDGSRERFVARVDGPRRVILDLDTTQIGESSE